jgi:radical SAM/Cys-rich protein
MEARHKSLKASGELLASANEQLKIINQPNQFPRFADKFEETLGSPLTTSQIEIFQINLGKMCNMVCKHCHVDAGPDRTEIMTKETLELCLDSLRKSNIEKVDLTGGAPEMNPHFKWFVEEVRKLDKHVMVRSNLTILVTNKFADYAKFMADNKVEIISSLPYYKASFTDKQRGYGTFNKSIEAMKILNDLGYGKDDSGLVLNLVYNPIGAFLPPAQKSLQNDYKKELLNSHGLVFNNLFTITNMPISRYLDYLIQSDNYEKYMGKLVNSYNPAAANNVMCKNTLSVSWEGYLYDCDFNQMLEMKVNHGAPTHLRDFNVELLEGRKILTGQHCYGCTAGAGSSCGGEIA